MVEKAYKPYGDVGTIKETEINIDKPDYPDQGISFAGYSKSLYAANQYRLNPQFFKNYNILNPADGSAVQIVVENNKKFYLKKIILTLTSTAGGVGRATLLVYEKTGVSVLLRLASSASVADERITKDWDFDVPIPLDDSFYYMYSGNGSVAAGTVFLNFIGWVE